MQLAKVPVIQLDDDNLLAPLLMQYLYVISFISIMKNLKHNFLQLTFLLCIDYKFLPTK